MRCRSVVGRSLIPLAVRSRAPASVLMVPTVIACVVAWIAPRSPIVIRRLCPHMRHIAILNFVGRFGRNCGPVVGRQRTGVGDQLIVGQALGLCQVPPGAGASDSLVPVKGRRVGRYGCEWALRSAESRVELGQKLVRAGSRPSNINKNGVAVRLVRLVAALGAHKI